MDTYLSTVCNVTAFISAVYTVGVACYCDKAIGLVYNLSTLSAGESFSLSYSYIFNGVSGINSALRPAVSTSVNGIFLVSDIRIFPNSANSLLNINCSGTIKNLAICNIMGKAIKSFT
jgi:hypothetical protein